MHRDNIDYLFYLCDDHVLLLLTCGWLGALCFMELNVAVVACTAKYSKSTYCFL
jgi:hypothetical protein